MKNNLGVTICQYRQQRNMTQEEFASRLGVTPQAVSKWERNNGLPDVSLLEGICRVLQISPNTLLGMEGLVVENGDSVAQMEIKNKMFAEPLLLEFGEDVIPCIVDGLKTNYINQKRKELVSKLGILMPMIRLRDSLELGKTEYRISSYGKVVCEDTIVCSNPDAYTKLIDVVANYCKDNYASIINKQIVKLMIDNVKSLYPGIADGLVPEQISYLSVMRKLQEKLLNGEDIRDMIHILEEMEENH